MAAAGFDNAASEMADIADTLWFASNSHRGNKRSQAVAAVKEDEKHPVGAVALSMQPK